MNNFNVFNKNQKCTLTNTQVTSPKERDIQIGNILSKIPNSISTIYYVIHRLTSSESENSDKPGKRKNFLDSHSLSLSL